jgi:3-oxoacyl-(acyl-carrier-protein) synthase
MDMTQPGAAANRVVITGHGIRTAAESIDVALAAHSRGESLVIEQPVSGGGDVCCVGAKAPMDPPFEYMSQRKWLKYMSPQTELAVWAAGNALRCAGLLGTASSPCDLSSMALLLATGPIAFTLDDVLPALVRARTPTGEVDFAALGVTGLRACSPMMPFHTLLNMPIGLVSMIFGMKGHNTIAYPDAEQSHQVLAQAVRGIEVGRLTSALVGGTAQLMSFMPYLTYQRLGWVAKDTMAARPFTGTHRGWALADGAAMLVLESEAQARARGATILAAVSTQAMPLDTDSAVEVVRSAGIDLLILSGSRDHEEDATARLIAGTERCLSLDGTIGYGGPVSTMLNLAVACRLLECSALFEGGTWAKRGRIAVLGAFGDCPSSRWGITLVESIS